MTARPWALVPAKGFSRGKARLAPMLRAEEREALSRAFLGHVLDVVRASDAVAGMLVVTECDRVAEAAARHGAIVVRDEATTLAAIVDLALARIDAGAIVLMSDLPELAPADVRDLALALEGADVVIAPDLRKAGTNALALATPRAMPTCFGHEDSFVRHLARARERSLRVTIHESRRLGFDVDEPADFAAMKRELRVSAA